MGKILKKNAQRSFADNHLCDLRNKLIHYSTVHIIQAFWYFFQNGYLHFEKSALTVYFIVWIFADNLIWIALWVSCSKMVGCKNPLGCMGFDIWHMLYCTHSQNILHSTNIQRRLTMVTNEAREVLFAKINGNYKLCWLLYRVSQKKYTQAF